MKLFEQAAERIDIALPIARKLKDKDELTRLLYSKALYHYVVYKDKQASDIAEQALASAKDLHPMTPSCLELELKHVEILVCELER